MIAVEMKQVNPTSSDLTMGLQLIGFYDTASLLTPKLNFTYNAGTLTLTWSSGTLQTNAPSGGWADVGAASSPWPVNNVPTRVPRTQLYRLR